MLVRIRKRIKAQSTAEYATLFAIIVGALIGMRQYMQRGFNAKYKDAVDMVTSVSGKVDIPGGGSFSLANTKQYDPYYAESHYSTQRHSQNTEKIKDKGETSTLTKQTVVRTGRETIKAAEEGE